MSVLVVAVSDGGSVCCAASEVRSIVEDEAVKVSKESDNYWVLAAALKRYLDQDGNGQLPIEVHSNLTSFTPPVVTEL